MSSLSIRPEEHFDFTMSGLILRMMTILVAQDDGSESWQNAQTGTSRTIQRLSQPLDRGEVTSDQTR